MTSDPRRHVDALDVVRICAVALVIGVHTLAFGGGPLTTPVGALVTLFHSSREIFFLLTSFALTHAYGRRPVRWGDFWRRRYLLVVVPYLGWSAIYFLLHRRHFDPVGATAARFAHDLLNGGAEYHLYFLLVSMEIYLVFPLVRWIVRRTAGHHGALLGVAAAYQVVVTLGIEHHAHFSGVLERWLAHPDPLLPSYLFYVLAGAIAAWHLDALTEFVRTRMAVVVGLVIAGMGAGVGAYLAQVASGASASVASAVFQPVVIAESVAFALGLFALGQRWADRGLPHQRLVHAGADGSFGIFLAHPLVLQAVLSVARSIGILGAVRRSPAAFEIAALLVVAVPLVYVLSGALTALARRTPGSLVLTGRRLRSARSSVAAVRPAAARTVAAAGAFVHPIHQEA